jgi:FkbM family methyltransferase
MNHNLESILKAFTARRTFGRLARLPLNLVPAAAVVPILTGRLRGKKWITGSAIHSCWLGIYEYQKQQRVFQEVRPGTIFYDVGAHVGFYSLLASALVGSGKVFAFEPLPRNLGYLRQHLALNRIANVDVLPVAVSDRTSTAAFRVEKTSFMGCLSGDGGIVVPTATLDSLVESGTILPPNYIKMDIEGSELLALQGAQKIFQRYRPVLFLATHSRQIHNECCRLLESWGYEWSPVGGDPLGDLGEVIAKSSVVVDENSARLRTIAGTA